MNVKDIVMRSEKEFSSEGFFLSHVFKMYETSDNDNWQVGFYSEEKDAVVPVEIEGDTIRVGQESEIFRKDKINKLVMDDVKLDISDALGKANLLQKEKYSVHNPVKIIVILQTIPEGTVYNITYITQSFKTLNIKVSAITGDIVADKLLSIFDFKGGEGKSN